MKTFVSALAAVLISIAASLTLLEIVLRFLPVNEGLRAQPVNARQPVFHYEPNHKAQYSNHWNFDNRNQVRVNNYGFVADYDYDADATSPLLAIIGDSYVEAQMVPFPQTITGRLNARAGDTGRVYAFAAAGAGLSQHMAWAKFARDEFHPGEFVFVIIGNDFKEALASRESSPGYHRFAHDAGNGWRMVRTDYEPSLVRRILRRSALAMYVITNLKLHVRLDIPLRLGRKDQRIKFVGNVQAQSDEALWKETTWAVSVYLDNLPEWTGVGADRIAFLIDGVRPQLYEKDGLESVSDSFWVRMREYFIAEGNFELD